MQVNEYGFVAFCAENIDVSWRSRDIGSIFYLIVSTRRSKTASSVPGTFIRSVQMRLGTPCAQLFNHKKIGNRLSRYSIRDGSSLEIG